MGCWPIAGVTSLEVNDADSLATLQAAADAGINFFDTAYAYGPHGESERLIAKALGSRRDELIVATKGGLALTPDGGKAIDASPETLGKHCDASLERLRTDYIDLYYLHAPDPKRPIEESALALKQLIASGKIRHVGASNCSLPQLKAFHQICPLTAIQPHYNMLQREIEAEILPWTQSEDIAAIIYWPLLKGLLAGQLPRNFEFKAGDGRAKYPMFQGDEWQKNQDFLDDLRQLADELERSVAEIVINWTIHQPGITSALCGAKRSYQIVESAQAMTFQLGTEARNRIDRALAKRGRPSSQAAV